VLTKRDAIRGHASWAKIDATQGQANNTGIATWP